MICWHNSQHQDGNSVRIIRTEIMTDFKASIIKILQGKIVNICETYEKIDIKKKEVEILELKL